MREQKFESYFGRKVAIDASMSIYQFLAGNVKDVEEYSKRSVRVRASSDVEELSWRTAEAPGGMHGQGIGPQTALKLIRQHKSIEAVLQNLNKDSAHLPFVYMDDSTNSDACHNTVPDVFFNYTAPFTMVRACTRTRTRIQSYICMHIHIHMRMCMPSLGS
eukprot:jgi/Mesen1/1189/ME001272S00370